MLTCYRRMGGVNNEAKHVYPAGLDKNTRYSVPELDRVLSGSTLMYGGLIPHFGQGDFKTVKYHFIARD